MPTSSADRIRIRWLHIGVATGVVVQLGMIALGISYLFSGDTPTTLFRLILWCSIGTGYTLAGIVILWALSRRRRGDDDPPWRAELSWPVRAVSTISTILASLVGIATAFVVVSLSSDPEVGRQITAVGVWVMLLAWFFLHSGFAQIYEADFFSLTPAPLKFPDTPNPGAVEFVYFAFTIGTTFAASDVEVHSARVRWQVVVHSVMSFFFNSLIVVFALNTLLQLGTPR